MCCVRDTDVALTNPVRFCRDIYFEDVSLWSSQMVLDDTVTQVSRLLNVPRHCLNIGATSKGLVAGSLSFVDAHRRAVDCRTSPTGSPYSKLDGFESIVPFRKESMV